MIIRRSIILFLSVFLLSISVFNLKIFAEENPVQVPVIMYHSLDDTSTDQWTLHYSAFEKDLQYLSQNNYTAVLLADVVNYVENGTPLPEKPIVLTFDDCYYNNLVYAMPLLEEYDMKMVISVIGSYSQEYSEMEDNNPHYAHLSWQDLKEMQDTGRVELANHTWGLHTNKNGRDGSCRKPGEDPQAYRQVLSGDVMRLQEKIEQECGSIPLCFTYPFGSKCPEALDILKELGFKVTLSCYEGMNYITKNNPDCLFDMRRVNRTPSKTVESILLELLKEKK